MAKPKIRFPEFTSDWEEIKAEDLFANVTDKNHPEETVLTIIQGFGTLPRSESGRNISYDEGSVSGYKLAEKGDFIIHLRSFEGGLEIANEKGLLSPAYTILRAKEDISTDFYYNYFHTAKFIGSTLAKSVEGIRDGRQISYNMFKFLKLVHPCYKEQCKIADLLSSTDELIKNQEAIISNLENQKSGLMQKLFSQEIRFSSPNGSYEEWSETTLGELCKIRTGKLDANAMVEGGAYRFYTCAAEYYQIDKYAFDTEALLISGNGANVGYVHYYKGKFNAYQRTYVLDEFEENIQYIRYYLEANLKTRIDNEKRAGNTPYIVLSTLTDMLIPLPSKEEQERIADSLSIFTEKIALENQKLLCMKKIKKGLLQQMFI